MRGNSDIGRQSFPIVSDCLVRDATCSKYRFDAIHTVTFLFQEGTLIWAQNFEDSCQGASHFFEFSSTNVLHCNFNLLIEDGRLWCQTFTAGQRERQAQVQLVDLCPWIFGRGTLAELLLFNSFEHILHSLPNFLDAMIANGA